MSLRAKVHVCCLVVAVLCELQTAAVKAVAAALDEAEGRHVR